MKNSAARNLKGRARDFQRLNEALKAAGGRRLSVKELNALTTEQLSKLLWEMRVKPDGEQLFDGKAGGKA